jgi:hypothetical protein
LAQWCFPFPARGPLSLYFFDNILSPDLPIVNKSPFKRRRGCLKTYKSLITSFHGAKKTRLIRHLSPLKGTRWTMLCYGILGFARVGPLADSLFFSAAILDGQAPFAVLSWGEHLFDVVGFQS